MDSSAAASPGTIRTSTAAGIRTATTTGGTIGPTAPTRAGSSTMTAATRAGCGRAAAPGAAAGKRHRLVVEFALGVLEPAFFGDSGLMRGDLDPGQRLRAGKGRDRDRHREHGERGDQGEIGQCAEAEARAPALGR